MKLLLVLQQVPLPSSGVAYLATHESKSEKERKQNWETLGIDMTIDEYRKLSRKYTGNVRSLNELTAEEKSEYQLLQDTRQKLAIQQAQKRQAVVNQRISNQQSRMKQGIDKTIVNIKP